MNMKPTMLLLLLLTAVVWPNRAHVDTSRMPLTSSIRGILPSLSCPANHSRMFYAVMFDGGSTGTRIHIYTFIERDSAELPVLDSEMFRSMKPGLSAYADSPQMAASTVRTMLRVAKNTVPRLEWKRTPVVLRATAGLRLLAVEKAQALLDAKRASHYGNDSNLAVKCNVSMFRNRWTFSPPLHQVQHVFDESPFLVPDNSVSIMKGTDEGILAWISVNFLSGHLQKHTTETVGILDLGGGSTQITFLPNVRDPSERVPFDIFNSSFELYAHSYLGNGLMAARLATLGASGAEGLGWQLFQSPCLPVKFQEDWSFGGLTYKVSGDPDGYSGYERCYEEVRKVVKGIIRRPYELEDSNVFFAFSYYFDRAVDAGLIDGVHGGVLAVGDFRRRATEVCNQMTQHPPGTSSPFLCMDLTYISCLLKDGFGFQDSTELQVTKKVNNVEVSWALGATLDLFDNLNVH